MHPPRINNVAWSEVLADLASANLTNLAMLNQMLGVNAATIEWMKASARTQAFGRDQGNIVDPPTDWLQTFGQGQDLAAEDNYFVGWNSKVSSRYGCMFDYSPGVGQCTGTPSRDWYGSGPDVGEAFALNVYRLRGTMVTVTKYDTVIRSQAISDGLNSGMVDGILLCPQGYGVPCGAFYNPAYPARRLPGVMQIAYLPIDGLSGQTALVQMPTAYDSGHTVPMRDPDNFASDVQEWFHGLDY